MNAKELRLGNIVTHEDYSSEIFKVIGMEKMSDGRTLINTEGGKNGTWVNPEECVNPVLLTEELLLNFGFTEYQNGDGNFGWEKDGFIYMNDCMIGLKGVFIGEESYLLSNFDGAFKYAHQIQNICLSLIAEELTLNT